ncbi:GNAT family N-acetyltransferase [Bacillus subtilis]|uniref:GNAT family N-acetyltransferase n=1 Tax=Pseudochrobactrum asaccharolyticum TaxID=354351 RepID=UPI001F3AF51A|nr:GNAT family N-acetyltransferase [Pseudochrobactrum asaccharolyticum]MCF7646293.1 GNAT family N-acetyltransferase [Pseudochrobactrum asaccharolyticum]MCF7673040.1 GNAT family N-acetyltransferase [Bacillus subtilis]
MSEIRQYEELGFHAWPAAQVTPLGDWIVQLTPYYPSKRGNSVNVLDPSDDADLAQRVEACEALFTAQGKQPVFRLTPLAPPALADYLTARGYTPAGGSSVMACDLRENAFLKVPQPRLPLRLVHFREDQEIGYSRISGDFHNRPAPQIEGLAEVLRSIKQQKYVIAGFSGAEPAATLLCVSENGYTGLLDLCIGEAFRRRGFAKALVLNEMAQALSRGDHRFWLQVETANHAARALYQGLGFSTVYDYIYYCR